MNFLSAECPLLAQSRHALALCKCLLLGVKRTWPMSAYDPKRTSRILRGLRGPTHSLKAALNLEDGSALEVVAGPHAAWPPRRRYPLPAAVIAADPPRSAADEEDSAVPVHEPAVAVERPATPRDRAAAAPAP